MNWKDEIQELRLAYYKAKFPHATRDHGIPAKNYDDRTRRGLINSIIDWLRFSGAAAKETGSLGKMIQDDRGRNVWSKSFARPQKFDILATFSGQLIQISIQKETEITPEKTTAGYVCKIACMQDFAMWWIDHFERVIIQPEPHNIIVNQQIDLFGENTGVKPIKF